MRLLAARESCGILVRLFWDEESRTGIVLHIVSAVAVAGRLGVTAAGTRLRMRSAVSIAPAT